MTLRVQILKDKINQSLGLPFKDLLPSSVIEQALLELKVRYKRRLFDPIVTLWAFLSQVLDTDKSCHSAVSKIIAYLAGEGVELPSTDTSGYCQARARIPEKLLEKLFGRVAQSLEEEVRTEYLWCGRNVKVIDGSTVSMPDTLENQKAYPQPKTQNSGCGFPIAKIGVIFSLATGAAVTLCIDVLNTHDIKLARKLYQFLNPLDILLGDRAFCAYADIVAIKKLDCDTVFRKHQSRTTSLHLAQKILTQPSNKIRDTNQKNSIHGWVNIFKPSIMRKGKIVGDCDKLVTWYKPKICPKGLSKDEFDTLPPSITVREVYYYIIIPGKFCGGVLPPQILPCFRSQRGAFNHDSIRYNNLFFSRTC